MVGCLAMEVNWGRERALISWTPAREIASSLYENVGEAKKRISRCCSYSVSWD